MALTPSGNRVYASILDLPAANDIRSGDSFIIQTTSGTSLLPFDSFLLPLDNVTFKGQIDEMWNSYTMNKTQVELIGNTPLDVNNLANDSENLCNAVNQLNNNDIDNYNLLATKINTIINIINLNKSSLTGVPEGGISALPIIED